MRNRFFAYISGHPLWNHPQWDNPRWQHLGEVLQSLGIVFGDIGTSPIYTLSAVFGFIDATPASIMGIISLVIWTLIILVMIQYAWLAMSLSSEHNEGGTIVLKELIMPYFRNAKTQRLLIIILCIAGISFFIGDAVITPAISILSAVEGLNLIPGIKPFNQATIMGIAIIISIALFAVQRRGVEIVARAFGPIMLVWFIVLGVMGAIMVAKNPAVFNAFNPMYALAFFIEYKFIAILVLSKVILCATGAEALYADMGHLGRKPIIRAWVFVFIMLSLMYMGQGAYLLDGGSRDQVFYSLARTLAPILYIPLLILSIFATIIASQAVIIGIFSIVYQGITTHMLPRLNVEYTSRKHHTQIYIPAVNTFLLLCVVFAIFKFKYSENLASAYGLAASFTMTITAIMLSIYFTVTAAHIKKFIAYGLVLVNFLFLFSCFFKIPSGGYVSLAIACIPFILTLIYTLGRRRLYKQMREMPIDVFVETYREVSQVVPRINGTAVYLIRTAKKMSRYVVQTMFTNNIMYEDNILVRVKIQNVPFGVHAEFRTDLAPGLRLFVIKMGYLEPLDLDKIFNMNEIYPKVIFYGHEDITTNNLFWRIFSILKKITPSFVQFYKLQRSKLHGVMVRVDI